MWTNYISIRAEYLTFLDVKKRLESILYETSDGIELDINKELYPKEVYDYIISDINSLKALRYTNTLQEQISHYESLEDRDQLRELILVLSTSLENEKNIHNDNITTINTNSEAKRENYESYYSDLIDSINNNYNKEKIRILDAKDKYFSEIKKIEEIYDASVDINEENYNKHREEILDDYNLKLII